VDRKGQLVRVLVQPGHGALQPEPRVAVVAHGRLDVLGLLIGLLQVGHCFLGAGLVCFVQQTGKDKRKRTQRKAERRHGQRTLENGKQGTPLAKMASSPSLKKRAKRLLSDGDDHEESAEGEAETSSEPATPTATRRRLTRRLSTPVVIEEEEDDDEDEDFVVSATPHDDDLSDTGDEDDVDSDDDEDDADDDNDAAMEQAGGSSAAAAAPRRAPRRQPRGEGQPRGGTRTQRKRAPAFMTPELAQLWDKLDETHPLVTAVAVDPPAQLKIELLPFQREGLGWLQRQEKSNFHVLE